MSLSCDFSRCFSTKAFICTSEESRRVLDLIFRLDSKTRNWSKLELVPIRLLTQVTAARLVERVCVNPHWSLYLVAPGVFRSAPVWLWLLRWHPGPSWSSADGRSVKARFGFHVHRVLHRNWKALLASKISLPVSTNTLSNVYVSLLFLNSFCSTEFCCIVWCAGFYSPDVINEVSSVTCSVFFRERVFILYSC